MIYTWSRYSDNGYEVSSKGDKRFSAYNAILPKGTEITLPTYRYSLQAYKDVVSNITINRSIETIYKKGTPIHVKGAILYNHYLKEYNITNKYPLLKEGEKLKFTYLKVPNPFKDTVISFPTRLPKEFELQNYVDYETQFEKTFIDPVQIILTSIGWNTEKKSTLEDFFG